MIYTMECFIQDPIDQDVEKNPTKNQNETNDSSAYWLFVNELG